MRSAWFLFHKIRLASEPFRRAVALEAREVQYHLSNGIKFVKN
jgi:hypothetical protein